MVSYAMSCLRFKGRKGLMSFGIVLNMFPGVLSMIAVYFVMKSLGLTNSHLGMIIVFTRNVSTKCLTTNPTVFFISGSPPLYCL